MNSSEKKGRRIRKRWLLLGAMLALAGGYFGVCCVPPERFRQVNAPREGKALNSRVAIVYSNQYLIRLGGFEKLHSFDIAKYAKIYLKLNTEGLLKPSDVFVPEEVSTEQVLLVHTKEFLDSLKDSRKVAAYLEAPYLAILPAAALDAGVLKAFRSATGGTILAARQALACGIGINLAGGYHHAMPQAGEGFNVYADLAIAIRVLRKEGLVKKVAVVDLDVHQGNGTGTIFHGDAAVFTFDMHEEDIYPDPKVQCSLDVGLDAGTGDEEYLRLLNYHLPRVLEQSRPDIVFFQGGCDVLAGDPLARLRISPEGLLKRDAAVIDECVRRKIPVVMVLGGGYSKGAWSAQYESIARTIRTYGLAGPQPDAAKRQPTWGESLYVK